MSQSPSPILPPNSDLAFWGVLSFCGAVVTAVLGWFGARFTAVARLEKTLLDASRSWVVQSQTRHAQDAVRISELEGEIIRMRGEVNSILQREQSLRRYIERSGLKPPPRLARLKGEAPADPDS